MQNENDTTEKRIAESVNQMRTALLDIGKLVNDALYTSYATMGDTWKAYSEACANIRLQVKPPLASPEPDYAGLAEIVARPNFDPAKMGRALEALACDKPVDFPVTFHTPSACAGAFLAKALPPPLPRGTYVNLPGLWAVRREGPENSRGERREYGAFCRTEEENGKEYFEIYADHELAAYGFVTSGHCLAKRMVNVMLKALIARHGHAMRNRQNRRAKRAAAENAAAPIEPADAIPPRPGLPEDDE